MRFVKPLLIVAPLLFASSYLNSAKNCECGTHEDGITAYAVSGAGCCSSPVIGNGVEHTYEENEGVWEVVDSTIINAATAQGNCCDANPPAAPPPPPPCC